MRSSTRTSGRGTQVTPPAATPAGPDEEQELPWRQLFGAAVSGFQDPLVGDLLRLTERAGAIPLSFGMPAPELLPFAELRDLITGVLADTGPAALLHSPTEGLSALRGTLAQMMAARGVDCAPDEVLVLSGSQQGLDLAARIFLDPGDAVVVEQPSFIGALQTFRGARARLIGVPTDEHGMRTDVLESVLARFRPKFIYTLPTFQNPSGAVLPLERRQHLLAALAALPGARHRGRPLLRAALRGRSGAVAAGAGPGGQRALPVHLLEAALPRHATRLPGRPARGGAAVRARAADGRPALEHARPVGARPVRAGRADERRTCAPSASAYRRRRDAMDAALREAAVPGLGWQRPQGGFYFWCRLPAGVRPAALLARAAEAGVSYLPGRACFADEPPAEFIRLNFSYPDEEQIREGVARLAAAIRQETGHPCATEIQAASTRPIV